MSESYVSNKICAISVDSECDLQHFLGKSWVGLAVDEARIVDKGDTGQISLA